jgi:hypothetical protein
MSKAFRETLDKNKCCRHFLHLWNKMVLPVTPLADEPVPRSCLDTAQVLLHGIACAASESFPTGDYTLVPDLITFWPSIWKWVQLLHIEHLLATSSNISPASPTARMRYNIIIKVLCIFTGWENDLFPVVAETDGYISFVTSLWVAESQDPNHHFELKAAKLVSLLIPKQASWVNEIITCCGGYPEDVFNICLDRIAAHIQQKHPTYIDLCADLLIIPLAIGPLDSPFMEVLASSSRCMVRAMGNLASHPSYQNAELKAQAVILCGAPLTAAFAFGGFNRVLDAIKAGLLPALIKAAEVCSQGSDPKTHDELIAKMLQKNVARYLIYRPAVSLVSSSLHRVNTQCLRSHMLRRSNSAKSWADLEKIAGIILARKQQYKAHPILFFICGNAHVSS